MLDVEVRRIKRLGVRIVGVGVTNEVSECFRSFSSAFVRVYVQVNFVYSLANLHIQEAQQSPGEARDALYQLKCCPNGVQITHTDPRVSLQRIFCNCHVSFGYLHKKRKEECLYIAFYTPRISQNAQAWITKFYLQIHHTCLSFVSFHQMAPPLTEVRDIQLQLTTHLSTPKG